MINKKKRLIGIFLAISLVVTMTLVSAVGVSMYYHETVPLEIGPDTTKTIDVASLMASHETEDIDIEIEVLEGGDIVSVVDSKITVLAGSTDNVIKLAISIPDVAEGTEYSIKMDVKETTVSGDDGMVGFTNSKTIVMPILVKIPTTESEPEGISTTWWILGIILVIVIIIVVKIILKGKKGQNSTPSKEPSKEEPTK
tara:strand:- start:345 stop:938 length:594 start_codon:yes stop_codon:yes gene_type:complete